MQFDITRIAATLTELRATGAQLADQLAAATKLGDDVFDSLRPFTHEWADGDVPRALTDAARVDLAGRLDEAVMQLGATRAGIDQAFGAGTWVSDIVEQGRGFHAEARDALLGRTLGDATADYAMDLLRRNGMRTSQAQTVLRDGDVVGMLQDSMRERIRHAGPEEFAAAAGYARLMAG